MATLRGLAGVAAVAVLFHCAVAATINVGGPNGGWDLTTDLKTWAASQKFTAGDTLVFQYTPTHDVVEVTKADYDACQGSNPIRTYTGGNTAIALPAPGKRYFICGIGGHCSGGMKLEVDVVSAASSAPPTASPASPTASPSPPIASPATPPPKSTPSPRIPKKSPSPSKAPKAAAPFPASPKNSPAPSSNAPGPAASAGPSGSPPASAPNSPSPSGSSPQAAAPSAAGGLKSSAAAGLVCGLLTLLAF